VNANPEDNMTRMVESEQRRGRSIIGTLALAVTAVSGGAYVALLIGGGEEMESLYDGDFGRALGSVLLLLFVAGAAMALILGAIALLRGHSKGIRADRAAGRFAIVWFVLALAVIAWIRV